MADPMGNMEHQGEAKQVAQGSEVEVQGVLKGVKVVMGDPERVQMGELRDMLKC